MDNLSLLVVLGILFVFGLVIFLMILSDRRRRRDQRRVAESLGFDPHDTVDDAVAQRLVELHRHSSTQDIRVENTATKERDGARLILFDLVDYGGDSVSTLVDTGIAVFSKRLALPRFSLISRVAEKGRLAEIANRFLEILIEQRRNRIQLNKNSHFEERYFLLGDDRPAIEEFLDEYRLSRLAQESYRHLEADRDCFTYSRFVFTTSGKRDRYADLKVDLAEARVLLEVLSNGSVS